jgi:heterodisulfide reductase subunit B2
MSVLGYFPGCSLVSSACEYDRSLRAVAAGLGIELREVPDWLCCGATSAHAVDRDAAWCLAADTLSKARHAGIDHVLAPCAMCYQRLASVVHEMKRRPELAVRLAEAFGDSPGLEQVKPLSVLDWLGNGVTDRLEPLVVRPLTGLRVACYYGCLLVRPPKITGIREVEAPRQLEQVVTRLGGQPVRWNMCTECCGASFALSRKEAVLRQGRLIFDAARRAAADVFCVACPMCHANLDMRQGQMGIAPAEQLPVLYLTQLMGWAMGLDAKVLSLGTHFVPVDRLWAKEKT